MSHSYTIERRGGHVGPPTEMTIEVRSIVRQITIVDCAARSIRRRAGSARPNRHPGVLGSVGELERQGVSRRVSAHMFRLGLRMYRRRLERSAKALVLHSGVECEVYATRGWPRSMPGEQRARVEQCNAEHGVADAYAGLELYSSQCLSGQGNGSGNGLESA
jgi:hypothetical protein